MRYILLPLFLLTMLCSQAQQPLKTEHVFIVTFDGYRWQELYRGADKHVINSKKHVRDIAATKKKYWAETVQERRHKLMPFFWDTLVKQATFIGNRDKGSKMKITNPALVSYPGYNEIFSGYGDPKIKNNSTPDNPNNTLFDLLQCNANYKDKCVAVASWDAFTRIFNTKRSGAAVFCTYKCEGGNITSNNTTYNSYSTNIPASNQYSEYDTITYRFAKEYLHRNHPRVAFIGFDETDHFGHEGQYDAYLDAANLMDKYIQDLWNFIQSEPQYKDKTTLLITTDHGRGGKHLAMWRHHGWPVAKARAIWMVAIGPDTPAMGEVTRKTSKKVFYQKQVGPTAAKLLGIEFYKGKKIGKAVDLVVK